MNLITPASLEKAKKTAQEQIKELANALLPTNSPNHEARKLEFLTAVDNNDDKRVNTMLVEALERYLGNDNLLIALGDFCQRMDLPSNVMELGEAGILEWISDHYSEISKKLNEEARNATK